MPKVEETMGRGNEIASEPSQVVFCGRMANELSEKRGIKVENSN